jgi:hypothetical protein
LLVEDIGSTNTLAYSVAWGELVAKANDIIEYSSITSKWTVSFPSKDATRVHYVTNLTSKVQYRFVDGVWVKSFEGWYDQGDYSIVI